MHCLEVSDYSVSLRIMYRAIQNLYHLNQVFQTEFERILKMGYSIIGVVVIFSDLKFNLILYI